jgi:ribosome biogenesis GTPase
LNIDESKYDMKGLVMRTTGSWYKVLPEGGDTTVAVDCRLRGNYRLRGNKQTNPVAVGDWVDYAMQEDGTGVIAEVHDRRNYIVRRATKLSKQTHVIAANVDRLCIVATLAFPRTSTGFIDRLLVTAEAYHIPTCIILNKADLYDETMTALHKELEDMYKRAGYAVYGVSALQGSGLEELRDMMKGHTTLFSGHSGVGKSALLNALVPGLELKVGEVSDWSLKGKHTTTFAEMIVVNAGGGVYEHPQEDDAPTLLIDTPGIKEFGMVDFKPEELSHFFPEMRAVLHDCHFANCTHRHEPHCAVKEAVETGSISTERYNNYLGIYDQIVNGE